MQRLQLLSGYRAQQRQILGVAQRPFSVTSGRSAGSQNSTPGWEGRTKDDHAVKRSEHDVQAQASQSGMREKGKEGSQGLSGKDERDSNKRAKEDHPEAPEPVIGMNSERGKKGY